MTVNMFHFTGRATKAPALTGTGDRAYAKLTLIANEYAGKGEGGEAKERKVAIPFTAFRGKAEALAKNVKKGDQLIVTARIENNNYEKGGEDHYDYNFIIEDFYFGAPGAESREAMRDLDFVPE